MKGYESTYDCSYGHLDRRYGDLHWSDSVCDLSGYQKVGYNQKMQPPLQGKAAFLIYH